MADEPPTGSAERQRLVLGRSPGPPLRLLMSAAQLSAAEPSLSEPALVLSALDDEQLSAWLEQVEVNTEDLETRLRASLREVSAAWDVRVLRSASGDVSEFYYYGGVPQLLGCAIALSSVDPAHPVDAVDVFVAALFDPHSVLSKALVLELNGDRDALIRNLCIVSHRYQHVAFPPTAAISVGAPIRLPWAKRSIAVEILRAALPSGAHWTYVRHADELHVYIDRETESQDLARRLRELQRN